MSDEMLREEVARLRARVAELEGRPKTATRMSEVQEVYAYWTHKCRRERAKLTADRRSKVLARLREDYTVADLKKAIDGAAKHAFVGSTGQRYDDLALICRNGSKVEDFMARADLGGTGPSLAAVL